MRLREKFLRAMRRESEEYLPFELDLCPQQRETFRQKMGTDDVAGCLGFSWRWVGADSIGDAQRFWGYHRSLENVRIDDWGVGYKAGRVAHFTQMKHPMEALESLEEMRDYPYPNPDMDYSWDTLAETIQELHTEGLAAIAGMGTTVFEMAWYLRGMDQFLVDMLEAPELAMYHLKRITDIRVEFARRYAEMDADVLFLGDDVGMQTGMIMAPTLWRRFIKPCLASVIQSARTAKPDILIAYHSDGKIGQIIPELIECGVQILNPIQPECMDPVQIKQLYGDRLSFWGTIGTQTTMPYGSALEVKAACEKMITEVGRGGGLLLAPSHNIEPEVPWENIEAFLGVVEEYNNR